MTLCRLAKVKNAAVAAAVTFGVIVCYSSLRSTNGNDVVAEHPVARGEARCEAPPHSHIIYFVTPPFFGGDPLWYFGAELANPFVRKGCSYSNCAITSRAACAGRASLVALQGPFSDECCHSAKPGGVVRCTDRNAQRMVEYEVPPLTQDNSFLFYQTEAPARTRRECLLPLDDFINYTWSYKSDSDIYRPYGGYYATLAPAAAAAGVPKDAYYLRPRNVLWYVSNCRGTKQAKARYEYAKELANYIDVDIKGACSGVRDNCSRNDVPCLTKVREQYKFYLSFENSRCDEYVTEKLFDALKFGNVPIVMGARRADYEALAPPGSFLFADDFGSPRELGEHLRSLADSPQKFAKYHEWRRTHQLNSEVTVINRAPTICKICELATLRPRKTVKVSDWWGGEHNCRPD